MLQCVTLINIVLFDTVFKQRFQPFLVMYEHVILKVKGHHVRGTSDKISETVRYTSVDVLRLKNGAVGIM